ncbi:MULTISPECIES: SHOCT domain-containing protein [unclassified Rhodococcus (in: high G+C Gram-positive bacteria)]|uniref:SHOCT domain-containing protein n=1 Tax=unclassified Rhodococcus (in: high G+C Gram-positive bacteria) TaxID=192944 RepID=UPI001639763A|nr:MULTISPECIES: SHOCT domain-containing protein [unclassified Rhodococcus (in: high G+C Gram-positive bacteria)]MBC2644422.1 PLDc N-terminal domain-containing protein [Rhodococcus sp. 3A]MBC2897886.1 PLDc N-terminal domain-containing protein [Rhodococcus sp. 4CII]
MLDSFWELFWYTLMVFAFVAYLIVLFQVLTDLFRDRTMSSIARILWIIFLIVLPYLTAFVYLIVRGRGIADRQREAQQAAKEATDTYIKDIAGKSPAEQIADAKALLDAGTISSAEFEQLKAKALS